VSIPQYKGRGEHKNVSILAKKYLQNWQQRKAVFAPLALSSMVCVIVLAAGVVWN